MISAMHLSMCHPVTIVLACEQVGLFLYYLVVSGFIAQGGDPTGTGEGEIIYGVVLRQDVDMYACTGIHQDRSGYI